MLKGFNKYSVQASSTGKQFQKTSISSNRDIGVKAGTNFFVKANIGEGSIPGNAGGSYALTGGSYATTHLLNTLSGYLPDEESNAGIYRRLYKDIYKYDNIAGAAIDLKACLPYSDFTITGCSSKERLEKFQQSVENISIVKNLRSITVDYNVLGAYLGSLGFNSDKGVFETLLSHDLDSATFKWVPFSGFDPIIDVTLSAELKMLLSDRDPRISQIRDLLPDYIVQGARSGKIALQPGSTLYIPRGGLSTDFRGQSAYTRLLTVHLIEKALIKGTIDRALKRQSAITHIKAGSDNWVPTNDELVSLANLFRDADIDPISAIVATRNDVEVSSERTISDIWKWDDMSEWAAQRKMQSLGINDSFLSGDASYNTLDATLSVFLNNLKADRDYMTNEIFYDKIFTAVSVANDFKIEPTKMEVSGSTVPDGYFNSNNRRGGIFEKNGKYVAVAKGNLRQRGYDVEDLSEYELPTLTWHKELKPEADKDYMDILQTLTDKGLPITLRMWAAAGGLNLDELMQELDNDVKTRSKIAKVLNQPESNPYLDMEDTIESQDSGGLDLSEFSSASQVGYIGLGNRDLEAMEPIRPHIVTKTGKLKRASERQSKIIDEKLNRKISKILAERAQFDNKINSIKED